MISSVQSQKYNNNGVKSCYNHPSCVGVILHVIFIIYMKNLVDVAKIMP